MKSLLILLALCACAMAQFGSTGQTGIVNAHNTMRRSIAKGTYVAKGTKKPAGSNIRQMKWDSALATQAQGYVNSCPDDHSGMSGVGENMYWYWTSGSLGDLNQYGAMASAAWEQEFQDYGWNSNYFDANLFNTGVGHATQMAWASTYLVGCGVKNCGLDDGFNKVEVVCQYKAQGNYLNQNIYTSGAACSACPSGTTCNDGLCA